jgi:sec-independent protein translocase protein TatA
MFDGLLQPMHLILVLAIVMIFFGPKKLPELGRGLGEAIRGFRDGMSPPEKPPAAPGADETSRIDKEDAR